MKRAMKYFTRDAMIEAVFLGGRSSKISAANPAPVENQQR
jgi:hypothetical protein